ncbi:MAG: hypothetical protein WBE26_15775, partial [Phycisphaerae bacterium]
SETHCCVIVGRSSKLGNRSLKDFIKEFVAQLSSEQGWFSGRLAESFVRSLQRAQQELLNTGANAELDARETMGIYGPIAGELRYSAGRLQCIAPIWSNWDSADYFDLFHADEQYAAIIEERLRHDALRWTESGLFDLAQLSRFVLRKSGDEDEVEIISKDITFGIIHAVLSRILDHSKSTSEVIFKLRDD